MRIAIDDLTSPDIIHLLERHLAFATATSPACHVHALDLEGLRAADITFWSLTDQEELIGCVALRELDATHGEIKSMHVAAERRGEQIGKRLMEHVLSVAHARHYQRLSLETGTQDGFEPARQLYARFGFLPCPPFGDYWDNPYSMCMTLIIDPAERDRP